MFDVFYTGKKPNLFAHERVAYSIEHAQQLSRTRMFWWVTYLCDYSGWDWLWEPVPWQAHQRHAWASQWQKDSGTYLVPCTGYEDTNYHSDQRIPRHVGVPCYEIDHLDGHAGLIPNTERSVRYFDTYRDTLIRLARSVPPEYEHIWVCSSICDYTDFDFSWHPEPWQTELLHVFESDGQRFGDTFYMHVPSFLSRAPQVELLEWYDLNFTEITVPRRPMPIIQHDLDTHAQAVKQKEFAGPLAVFTVNHKPMSHLPTVPLWRESTKTIVPLSRGAESVIVPKTAVPYIQRQLYDYAYIDTQHRKLADERLDIVYISNGEVNSEFNWTRLLSHTRLKDSRVHRVKNVKGRVAAYHAAARASTTPWFFAVFAKLDVLHNFDFGWQPDRLQEPKHYIFHALNPVNRLEYGHQAMIAYNRELVLNNPGHGLDFTLDSMHEVVPILSGTARYDTSAWSAWRTAFREVLKLRHSLPDFENEYRLRRWLEHNTENDYGRWSHIGAEDAMEYWDQVNGDFEQIRRSYEWDWLASYAFIRRGLLPQ